jgi:hypothetical protein
MPGLTRAVGRLVLMAMVTAAVLVAATALGLPVAAVLGLAVTAAGLVGLVTLSRRRALVAVPISSPTTAPAFLPGLDPATPDPDADPVAAAMAPEAAIDPELLMPRWRRPSLLAARRADPTRVAHTERPALRFEAGVPREGQVRTVRYAVVPLLDRPDDVLGRQLADLMAGDEVDVLDTSGPYWQVICPDGLQGWVHRTTLGAAPESRWQGRSSEPSEANDLLTAVLSARGIQ